MTKESLDLVSNTYDFARTAGGDSHTGSDCIGNLMQAMKNIPSWVGVMTPKEKRIIILIYKC